MKYLDNKANEFAEHLTRLGLAEDSRHALRFGYWAVLASIDLVADGYPNRMQELAEIEMEHFIGEHDSTASFCEQYTTDVVGYEIDALPNFVKNAIDYAEMWRRELRHEFTEQETPEGSVWIWHNH